MPIFKLMESLFLTGRGHVSQNDHFTGRPVKFPASENKDVRANGRCSVAVPAQRRLALEFALLPDELVISVENDKVVDIGWRDEVLLASGTRVDAPASEEYDVRPTDVGSMAVAGKRRSP